MTPFAAGPTAPVPAPEATAPLKGRLGGKALRLLCEALPSLLLLLTVWQLTAMGIPWLQLIDFDSAEESNVASQGYAEGGHESGPSADEGIELRSQARGLTPARVVAAPFGGAGETRRRREHGERSQDAFAQHPAIADDPGVGHAPDLFRSRA